MFRAALFVVVLSISLVDADRLEAPGSKQPALLIRSRFGYSEANGSVPTRGRNVFGQDDRTAMESTDYPWRAIGKLSTGCTGTLVGRDLVLTAAHCVIDPKTRTLYSYAIYFYAGMINGAENNKASVSHTWWGTSHPDDQRENDWALLRLDTKLGNSQGWFGSQEISLDTMKSTDGILVGYSTDFRSGQTAGIQRHCKITKQYRTSVFLHDCDMTRGASGGPIFAYWNNQPIVYALNVADFRNDGDASLQLPQYTDANANVAIWSNELQTKIIELQGS